MTKVPTTIRIEAELRASLNKICVRTGDQTYHIEQALRAYGPIKKLAKKTEQKVAVKPKLPDPFQAVNVEAWKEWVNSPSSKITEASAKKQFKLLAAYSMADQQLIIDASINSGWQGLFPLKGQQKATEGFVAKHTDKTWQDEIMAQDDEL